MRRWFFTLAMIFISPLLWAGVTERVVVDFSDLPLEGTLRTILQAACVEDGDDLITFNPTFEKEPRIYLNEPLSIPENCHGKITIKGLEGMILDGSLMMGEVGQPGEICLLSIDGQGQTVEKMIFVGNKLGAGLCVFGRYNTIQKNTFGEAVEDYHPNLYGVVISDVHATGDPETKDPLLDGKFNKVLENNFLPGSQTAIWIHADAWLLPDNPKEDFQQIIKGNIIDGPTEWGILSVADHAQILENKITQSEKNGLYSKGSGVLIEGNQIKENKGFGIWHEGADSTLISNVVEKSGGEGISLVNADQSKVTDNDSKENGSHGFYIGGEGIAVENNSSTDNQDEGMLIEGKGIVLRKNEVADNKKSGMVLVGDEHQVVESNHIHSNGERGLYVKGNKFLCEECLIEENGKTGLMGEGDQLTIRRSLIQKNQESGVHIMGHWAKIEGSQILENKGQGVKIFGNEALLGLVEQDNVPGANAGPNTEPTDTCLPEQNCIIKNGGVGVYVEGDTSKIIKNWIESNQGGVQIDGAGALLKRNQVRTNSLDGIYLHGDGSVISNNFITDSSQHGVALIGDDHHVIEKNQVRGAGAAALYVQGDRVVVNDNSFQDAQQGIYVAGKGADIGLNTVANMRQQGVFVLGDMNQVVGNGVSNCSGNGLEVQGNDAFISGNAVHVNRQHGIVLLGAGGDLIGSSMNNNTVEDNSLNGIFSSGSSKLLTVSGNKVSRNGDNGMLVSDVHVGAKITCTNNKIYENRKDGLYVVAMKMTIIRNVAIANLGKGIVALQEGLGSGRSLPSDGLMSILNNAVLKNGDWGIFSKASGAKILKNKMVSNQGGGLYHEGPKVTLQGNRFELNRDRGALLYTVAGWISDNKVLDNDGEGIHVEVKEDALPTTIQGNHFVHNTGIGLAAYGPHLKLINNEATINGGDGFYLAGSHGLLQGNQLVVENGGWGAEIIGSENQVISNNFTSNSEGGLFVQGSQGVVTQNGILNNKKIGSLLQGEGFTVTKNTMSKNAGDGIWLTGSGSSLLGNTVQDNEGHGIYLQGGDDKVIPLAVVGPGGKVTNEVNLVSGNKASGIQLLGDHFEVRECQIEKNANDGVWLVGNGSVFSANSVKENGNHGMNLSGNDNKVIASNAIGNSVSGNQQQGLHLVGDNFAVSLSDIFENGADGISIQGSGATITQNKVTSNKTNGILVDGSAINIADNTITENDAWGATAKGNAHHFEKNVIQQNKQGGISLGGDALVVTQNEVSVNMGDGVSIQGTGATVTLNKLVSNKANGILVDGSAINIVANTITENDAWGAMAKGSAHHFEKNVIQQNKQGGLSLGGDALFLTHNEVTANIGDGVWLEGNGCVFSANVVTGNENNGMSISGNDNKIIAIDSIGNSIGSNQKQGLHLIGDHFEVSLSDIFENGADGVSLQGAKSILTGNNMVKNSGPGATVNGNGHHFDKNMFKENQKMGIYLAGDDLSLTGNQVISNGLHGVWMKGKNAQLIANNILANGGCPGSSLLGSQKVPCLAAGEGGIGIWIDASSQGFVIGGDNFMEDHNTIQYNRDGGIVIAGDKETYRHEVTKNIISKNYSIGPGLDLANDGYTLNDLDDSDEGPNHLLNYIDYLQSFPLVKAPDGSDRYWSWGLAHYGTRVELYGVAAEDVERGITHGGGDDYFGDGTVNDRTFQVMPQANFNYPELGWVTSLSFDAEGDTSEYVTNIAVGADKDLDGIVDHFEKGGKMGDATLVDTDGDGLPDSVEDKNRNGICEAELQETCAYLADTDGDGLSDWAETHGDGIYDPGVDTNPWLVDTDEDGIPDGQEDNNHNGIWEYDLKETNPLKADSDEDGVNDHNDNCPTLANSGQETGYCSL